MDEAERSRTDERSSAAARPWRSASSLRRRSDSSRMDLVSDVCLSMPSKTCPKVTMVSSCGGSVVGVDGWFAVASDGGVEPDEAIFLGRFFRKVLRCGKDTLPDCLAASEHSQLTRGI